MKSGAATADDAADISAADTLALPPLGRFEGAEPIVHAARAGDVNCALRRAAAALILLPCPMRAGNISIVPNCTRGLRGRLLLRGVASVDEMGDGVDDGSGRVALDRAVEARRRLDDEIDVGVCCVVVRRRMGEGEGEPTVAGGATQHVDGDEVGNDTECECA